MQPTAALAAEPFGSTKCAEELSGEQVRQRMRAAVRTGQPRWLWPDVALSDWQDALIRLEAVLRGVLTGGPRPSLDGDPRVVGLACYTSGVGPLLGLWLAEGRIAATPTVADILAQHLAHNRVRMAKLAARAREILQQFAEVGVAATLLKGLHTAHVYFPEHGARPMSDIDLLVEPHQQHRAEAALRALGYACTSANTGPPRQNVWEQPGARREPRTLTFVHADDPWSVDLQFSLDRRCGTRDVHLDELRGSPPRRSAGAPFGSAGLDQPLLLLHLAVHAGHNFNSLTLVRLVELALVIRRDRQHGRLDWTDFLDKSAGLGALGVAYPPLHFCERLVPGTVPRKVLEAGRSATLPAVIAVMKGLGPASAQQIARCSMNERYMWAPSPGAKLMQAVRELLPRGHRSPAKLLSIYRNRFWRIACKTITRT